jgi:hypothetical protein
MGVATNVFKRGQLTLALWHTFAGPFVVLDVPVPPGFARRVGKFIELGVGCDQRPGSGTDLDFSLADVVEIGVALDLQDIGLNQLEIAQFIMTYRRQLRAQIAVMDLIQGQGQPVFMLLRSRAATEPVRFTEDPAVSHSFKKGITWYEPEFFAGGEDLSRRLGQLLDRDRKRLLIEIRDLVLSLAYYLPQMPVKKRGR